LFPKPDMTCTLNAIQLLIKLTKSALFDQIEFLIFTETYFRL